MWPRLIALGVAVVLLLLPCGATAEGRRYAIGSPGGRSIYTDDATFQAAVNQNTRRFVLEMALGSAPEGNLGMLLGFLNFPVRGLEYYVGFGLEFNPSRQYTASVRYVFNIKGYRPYASLGYLYRDVYTLRTYDHDVFGELGYKWVIHRTHHLTAGVGLRRILTIGIHEDSPLRDDDVDPELLAAQKHAVNRWIPTFALRFSRAF